MVLSAIWWKQRNSPSNVREFLHPKISYTSFTRKFKEMRAFERFKNEIWCMDLAYVDELAEDNSRVKYLLVHQVLFDRTVDAKGMKTRVSKETVKTLSKMIIKKNKSMKIWVNQGTDFAGEFKSFCSAEGQEIYSTMSETKSAFAERTVRSLKNILYRYMEDYRYKYIQKTPHFIVPLNSRNNRGIELKPNHVNNSDFMSILFSKPLRIYKNPKLDLEIRFSSLSMIYPSGKVIHHNLPKKFWKFLSLLLKNLQHVQWTTNKKKSYEGNFARRKWLESFEYGLVHKLRIIAALSKQYAQFIYKFFARASEFG